MQGRRSVLSAALLALIAAGPAQVLALPLPATPLLADPHEAAASPACYRAEAWDAAVLGGRIGCSADGGAVRLTSQAGAWRCGGRSGGARLLSEAAFAPPAVAVVEARGNDAPGLTFAFGWTDHHEVACFNFWDSPDGVFVTTNAFGPEGRRENVGFRSMAGGAQQHRIVDVGDEQAFHTYTLVWLPGEAHLLVDGALRASTTLAPEGPLRFSLAVSSWAGQTSLAWGEAAVTVVG